MSIDPETILVVGIVFLSTTIRSTFGFGDAMVAMPLLALAGKFEIAPALVALTSATVAGAIIIKDRKDVQWKSAAWLVGTACLGIPVGQIWFSSFDPSDQRIVKILLALMIIAFAIFSLLGRRPIQLKTDKSIYLFGFTAGVLGGAYNTHGPPLIVYGTLRGWSASEFRATLQGYFFPTSLLIIVMHVSAGSCTAEVVNYYLLALPLIVTAILVGAKLNVVVQKRGFSRYVWIMLIAISGMLLFESLRTS